ncbi:MAG: choice-of-anchor L domain-containing protein, partial [Bacteroidota bacterium]
FGEAFAFFLEGPNVMPNGRANIARLPNGERVSSETLNHIETPTLFRDNSFISFGPCTGAPNDPDTEQQVAYDGFSTKLRIKAAVTPCERHVLKLMVIDALDFNLDSGILLEAGSFTAGLIADPEPSVAGVAGSVTPVEACDTATITFSRLFSDADDLMTPLEVNYNLITTGGGMNLADNGTDFELPPSPFIIPAGDSTATLKIPILGDANNSEGVEAFIVRYDGTCNCDQNRDTFYIQDATDLILDVTPDQDLCAGQNLQLSVDVMGGAPGYTYSWPDGQDAPQVNFTATGRDTLIYVSVVDSCGLMGRDSILISAPNVSASTTGAFSLCSSPTAAVLVDVEGTGPFTINLQVDTNGTTTTTSYVISNDTSFVFAQDASVRVVSVTDASGCGGAATGTATVTSAGIAIASQVSQPTCDNNNGNIQLTVTGGNANHTFSWADDPTSTTGTRTNLPPAVYSVDIARASDPTCSQNFTFTLSPPTPLVIDSFAFAAPDCPGENVDLAVVVSGGTAPYTYVWPGEPDLDSILTVTAVTGQTTYAVIVTDDCGVETSGSVTIDLPTFSAELSGRYSLCNASSVDVPITLTGPAGNYEVAVEVITAGMRDTLRQTVSPGMTIIPFTFAAEINLLSVTNVSGCTGDIIGGMAITIVDPMINFAGSVEHVSCHGEATGSITLTNPGTVPLTFQWNDAVTTANRSGLVAGTYSVTITDAADAACFRDTSFTISQPDALAGSLVVSGPTPQCAGASLTLAAAYSGGTPPYQVDWNNGTSTDSLFNVISSPGQQAIPLEIMDDCGAVFRDTFRLDLPDIVAAVSGSFSVCNAPFNVDVPFTFTGSTAYTFTIAENGTPRTLTVSGDTSLNYTAATSIQLLSVTGATGCAGQAGGIATVSDGNFAVTASVTDVLCAGQATGAIAFTINNNPGGYSYNWDRPQLDGNDVSGLTTGTYSVTATELSPNGCQWDTTFTIIEPASTITFLRDSSRDVTCTSQAFASASYTGGTGVLTYRWSNGTEGPILGEVPAGIYELSVTDENSCELVQTFNLRDRRVNIFADISATATELNCSQTTLMLSAQQNTVPVNHTWRDQNGQVVGNSRTLTITAAGSYSVLVEDPSNGCSANDTITITLSDDLLDLELPAIHALNCDNQSVDLTVTQPNFVGAVDYTWRLNGNIVGNAATLPNITNTGIFEVTVIRQDNGCPTTVQTEVLVDRMEPTVMVPSPILTSSCLTPEVTVAIAANGPYSFSWSTTDGNLSGPTDQLTATTTRPGTYSALVRDTTNGCTTVRSVQVVQDGATLTAMAGTDQTLVCTGLGTTLFGGFAENLSGSTGRWYGPDGTQISDSRQAFTTVAGAFVFEAIHPVSGCSSFDTLLVISEAPTEVAYTLQQAPCPEVGGRLFVTEVTGNNGPFMFSSPTGQTEPFGTGLRGLPAGNNVLIVTDQLGCELRDTFQIFDFGSFTGRAEDVSIILGEEAVLGVQTNREAGALVQWEWSNLPDSSACFTCPEPVLRPLESFIATVAVTDTNGCTVNIRQNVIVAEKELVYMPTAFSPNNGDGVNDVYTVFGDPEFVRQVNSFGI